MSSGVQRPTEHRDPLAHPDQPTAHVAVVGEPGIRPPSAAAIVHDLDDQCRRLVAEGDLRAPLRRMLQRVRERLLDDPIGGELQAGVQLAWLAALYAIFGRGFSLDGAGIAYVIGAAAIELLKSVLWVLIIVVIVQAVLSWVAPDGPLAGLLNALTFPFLRPLRRVIPPIGGSLDLTPLVLIVILQLILMLPVRWLEQALAMTLR